MVYMDRDYTQGPRGIVGGFKGSYKPILTWHCLSSNIFVTLVTCRTSVFVITTRWNMYNICVVSCIVKFMNNTCCRLHHIWLHTPTVNAIQINVNQLQSNTKCGCNRKIQHKCLFVTYLHEY